jgi:hypothetical protein
VRDREALVTLIDSLLAAVTDLGLDAQVQAVAPTMWEAGSDLVESPTPPVQRVGYVLLLDALSQAPETTRLLVQRLRAALIATDPALARMTEPAPSA